MSLEWLFGRMRTQPERDAVIWGDEDHTYARLLTAVERWDDVLDANGITPGHVTSIEGDYSPASIALFLALVHRGAIVVPISGVADDNRARFRGIAEVETIFTLSEGSECRVSRTAAMVTHPLLRRLRELGAPGLVLFSSGSTGESKAILHNMSSLLEKHQKPRPPFRTLAFLLLDHIGGVNTLFSVLSSGGAVVCVRGRSPGEVCAAVARHRVELLPVSPSFLTLMLLSEQHLHHDLSSLKIITYGTEPMPEATLARLHDALPRVELRQTYGLSELGILRAKSRDSGSLWVRVGGEGYETKVVDGTLRIRAASAMMGYLNAPQPFDDEGWLDTGDAVLQDGDYLRILGRISEIINVGGQKVYPAEVEGVLVQMPGVRDVTVTAEPNPILGQVVAARFVLEEPVPRSEFTRRLKQFCAGRLEPYKMPVRVTFGDSAQVNERFKKVRRVP